MQPCAYEQETNPSFRACSRIIRASVSRSSCSHARRPFHSRGMCRGLLRGFFFSFFFFCCSCWLKVCWTWPGSPCADNNKVSCELRSCAVGVGLTALVCQQQQLAVNSQVSGGACRSMEVKITVVLEHVHQSTFFLYHYGFAWEYKMRKLDSCPLKWSTDLDTSILFPHYI